MYYDWDVKISLQAKLHPDRKVPSYTDLLNFSPARTGIHIDFAFLSHYLHCGILLGKNFFRYKRIPSFLVSSSFPPNIKRYHPTPSNAQNNRICHWLLLQLPSSSHSSFVICYCSNDYIL